MIRPQPRQLYFASLMALYQCTYTLCRRLANRQAEWVDWVGCLDKLWLQHLWARLSTAITVAEAITRLLSVTRLGCCVDNDENIESYRLYKRLRSFHHPWRARSGVWLQAYAITL